MVTHGRLIVKDSSNPCVSPQSWVRVVLEALNYDNWYSGLTVSESGSSCLIMHPRLRAYTLAYSLNRASLARRFLLNSRSMNQHLRFLITKQLQKLALFLPLLVNLAIIAITSLILGDSPDSETAIPADTSHRLTIADFSWSYIDRGQGPTVLLIHGFAAHKETWAEAIAKLDSDYRLIAVDLPGHGRSDKPQVDYTADYFVTKMQEFCTALQLDNCIIVGNSLGGGIAATLALQQPQLVQALVLVDSLIYPQTSLAFIQKVGIPLLAPLSDYLFCRLTTKLVLRQVFYDDRKVTPALIDRYDRFYAASPPRQAAVSTMAHLDFSHIAPAIGKITRPTLILWGENDRWLPVSNAYSLHAEIPNSELAIIRHCGHVPMEECPSEFTHAFRRFAAALNPPSKSKPGSFGSWLPVGSFEDNLIMPYAAFRLFSSSYR